MEGAADPTTAVAVAAPETAAAPATGAGAPMTAIQQQLALAQGAALAAQQAAQAAKPAVQQPGQPQQPGQIPQSWIAGKGGGGGGGSSKYEGEGEPSDNLYIMGLPKEFDSDAVQQFFGALGTVIQCKSFGNGYALVRFSTLEGATTVKNSLHGQKPIGCEKPLTITYALGKKSDWYCPKCGDLQFQKNQQCRLCGAPKDENAIPAEGSTEKGKGYGKAMDAGKGFGKAGGNGCFNCGGPHMARECPEGKGAGKPGPYAKGEAIKGKGKEGPMCSINEFIAELVTGGLPGGDQDLEQNCLYVGGLPDDTTNENLYQIFGTFGSLIPKGARIDLGYVGEELKCSGSGYVSFMEATSADMAVLALNGIKLNSGIILEVRKKYEGV